MQLPAGSISYVNTKPSQKKTLENYCKGMSALLDISALAEVHFGICNENQELTVKSTLITSLHQCPISKRLCKRQTGNPMFSGEKNIVVTFLAAVSVSYGCPIISNRFRSRRLFWNRSPRTTRWRNVSSLTEVALG